jgi:hypothetical protein
MNTYVRQESYPEIKKVRNQIKEIKRKGSI